MSEPLFDPDLAGQADHGRAGFGPYDLTVASPELPCGAAWLASCLLELGLPLFRPWGIVDRHSWQPLGGRRFRYRFAGSGWSRLVPGLVDGREFRLRARPVPRFCHAWPGQLPMTARVVLVVRDPRDALRSEWLRRRRIGTLAREMGLHAFVTEPLPGWGIDRRQHLALQLSAWLAAAPQALILRFEDFKQDADGALGRVLDRLDLRRPARARARALKASTHAAVVAAERRLLAGGIVPTPLLGPGRPLAWRDDPAALTMPMPPLLADLCERLGYAPAARIEPAPEGDRDVLLERLQAPGCAEPERLRHALQRVLGLHSASGGLGN